MSDSTLRSLNHSLHLVVPERISHVGKLFRDGQYSLVSFLFAVLLTVPPAHHGLGAFGFITVLASCYKLTQSNPIHLAERTYSVSIGIR